MNILSNTIGETFIRVFGCGSTYLDSENILWKLVNDKLIGKRSVWNKDYSASWLEDTKPQLIDKYWCGEDADYSEIFTRKL